MFDAARRILLIERGQPPSQGTWSVPGGRCRAAESAANACVREVVEETGLVVEIVRWVGRVERNSSRGATYVIDDFECRLSEGDADAVPHAGDDAVDARWITRAQLSTLALAPGLLEALTGWDVLPN